MRYHASYQLPVTISYHCGNDLVVNVLLSIGASYSCLRVSFTALRAWHLSLFCEDGFFDGLSFSQRFSFPVQFSVSFSQMFSRHIPTSRWTNKKQMDRSLAWIPANVAEAKKWTFVWNKSSLKALRKKTCSMFTVVQIARNQTSYLIATSHKTNSKMNYLECYSNRLEGACLEFLKVFNSDSYGRTLQESLAWVWAARKKNRFHPPASAMGDSDKKDSKATDVDIQRGMGTPPACSDF